MQPALHITTKVLPGNKIEIDIPDAEIGDSVDVFVILPELGIERNLGLKQKLKNRIQEIHDTNMHELQDNSLPTLSQPIPIIVCSEALV
jgi:hypothetical protein